MRLFLLTITFATAIFNCLLGYSGAVLSYVVRKSVDHLGVELSLLTEFAFDLQPWFYLLAFCVLVTGVLGLRRKLSENQLIILIVTFLAVDIFGLFISAWGFGTAYFLLCAWPSCAV
jgi:hypothetical protein